MSGTIKTSSGSVFNIKQRKQLNGTSAPTTSIIPQEILDNVRATTRALKGASEHRFTEEQSNMPNESRAEAVIQRYHRSVAEKAGNPQQAPRFGHHVGRGATASLQTTPSIQSRATTMDSQAGIRPNFPSPREWLNSKSKPSMYYESQVSAQSAYGLHRRTEDYTMNKVRNVPTAQRPIHCDGSGYKRKLNDSADSETESRNKARRTSPPPSNQQVELQTRATQRSRNSSEEDPVGQLAPMSAVPYLNMPKGPYPSIDPMITAAYAMAEEAQRNKLSRGGLAAQSPPTEEIRHTLPRHDAEKKRSYECMKLDEPNLPKNLPSMEAMNKRLRRDVPTSPYQRRAESTVVKAIQRGDFIHPSDFKKRLVETAKPTSSSITQQAGNTSDDEFPVDEDIFMVDGALLDANNTEISKHDKASKNATDEINDVIVDDVACEGGKVVNESIVRINSASIDTSSSRRLQGVAVTANDINSEGQMSQRTTVNSGTQVDMTSAKRPNCYDKCTSPEVMRRHIDASDRDATGLSRAQQEEAFRPSTESLGVERAIGDILPERTQLESLRSQSRVALTDNLSAKEGPIHKSPRNESPKKDFSKADQAQIDDALKAFADACDDLYAPLYAPEPEAIPTQGRPEDPEIVNSDDHQGTVVMEDKVIGASTLFETAVRVYKDTKAGGSVPVNEDFFDDDEFDEIFASLDKQAEGPESNVGRAQYDDSSRRVKETSSTENPTIDGGLLQPSNLANTASMSHDQIAQGDSTAVGSPNYGAEYENTLNAFRESIGAARMPIEKEEAHTDQSTHVAMNKAKTSENTGQTALRARQSSAQHLGSQVPHASRLLQATEQDAAHFAKGPSGSRCWVPPPGAAKSKTPQEPATNPPAPTDPTSVLKELLAMDNSKESVAGAMAVVLRMAPGNHLGGSLSNPDFTGAETVRAMVAAKLKGARYRSHDPDIERRNSRRYHAIKKYRVLSGYVAESHKPLKLSNLREMTTAEDSLEDLPKSTSSPGVASSAIRPSYFRTNVVARESSQQVIKTQRIALWKKFQSQNKMLRRSVFTEVKNILDKEKKKFTAREPSGMKLNGA